MTRGEGGRAGRCRGGTIWGIALWGLIVVNAKWRLDDLSFIFLVFCLLWCSWDYPGDIYLLDMASLLPFFGWAFLPNVSGARCGAIQHVE